jgi:hypothetical protein
MNLQFDCYKHLEYVDIYLYNPDKRPIACMKGSERKILLRFNKTSEISFEVPKRHTNFKGETTKTQYWDRLESNMLIYVMYLGWFVIQTISEYNDGHMATKTITALSLQENLKKIPFYTEARTYRLYNPDDPTDDKYDPNDPAAIPSVIGQLYQQAGIKFDLNWKNNEHKHKIVSKQWVLSGIDINPEHYADDYWNVYRTFPEAQTINVYGFLTKSVVQTFDVLVLFDFMYNEIKIKTAETAGKPTNIYLSFKNLLRGIAAVDSYENVSTVLTCEDDGIDISLVNPMGTKYIVDFSHYMEERAERPSLMSPELIAALKEWRALYEEKVDETGDGSYAALIGRLNDIVFKRRGIPIGLCLLRQENPGFGNGTRPKNRERRVGFVRRGNREARRIQLGRRIPVPKGRRGKVFGRRGLRLPRRAAGIRRKRGQICVRGRGRERYSRKQSCRGTAVFRGRRERGRQDL